jgi:hypothetical protein
VGNTQNTASRPSSSNSYGWNVGNTQNQAPRPSAPVGPPPAYPGLQNRPVPSNNAPPAYQPSNYNPPAYSPSHNIPSSYNNPPSYQSNYGNKPNSYGTNNNNYGNNANTFNRQNTYNTHSSYPGYSNSYTPNNHYGSSFGSSGLPGNTYISNNYYGSQQRSGGFGGGFGGGFLSSALFYGAGMHSGYMWGQRNAYEKRWNEEKDREWRATTSAPYFENKIPGEDKILPASAVVGAATAFGLVSLLPLNVPANKPIMYCNNTDLAQAQVKINNETLYQCINGTFVASCPKIVVGENETIVDECKKQSMMCDNNASDIYCSNGTLLSKNTIFCNSTTVLNGTVQLNETTTILNCYNGELPQSQASFIPTTTTEAPVTTTTEKSLSFGAKMHVWFMKLIGKSDVLEKPPTTTTSTTESPEIPQLALDEGNKTQWTPEALTIPPETTTTTTTEAPFEWMMEIPHVFENGTVGTTRVKYIRLLYKMLNFNDFFKMPVAKSMIETLDKVQNLMKSGAENITMPPNFVKVPITKPMEVTTLSSADEASSTLSTPASS